MISGTVLVTGGTGLIGDYLVRRLTSVGFQIITVGRRKPVKPACPHLTVDLLDKDSLRTALSSLNNISVVIHLAAIAHGQPPPKNYTIRTANVKMLRNLVEVVSGEDVHWIFASSVSVYGEGDSLSEHSIGMELNPVSEYGKSKKECEDIVFGVSENVDILRLAPVYSETAYADVSKRVYIPSTRIRLKLIPAPRHSLCSTSTVVFLVFAILSRGPNGHWIHQVSDDELLSQSVLLEWFDGWVLPFPVVIGRVVMSALGKIPGAKTYSIRCGLKKFFCDNSFPRASVKIS